MDIKRIMKPFFHSFVLPLVYAHCDTVNGPVVTAAKHALEQEKVNLILIWVKHEQEEALKEIFQKTLAEGKNTKTQQEKNAVDMAFFETVVRLHREGEGAPFEGIKPAGSVAEEIALADHAVETGSLEIVLDRIQSLEDKVHVKSLFQELQEKSHYNSENLTAGREYVAAYAHFLHSAENAMKGNTTQSTSH